jgi:hypothetical protein
MATQSVDVDLCNTSPSPTQSMSAPPQHLTRDPDFSVSWLLGISGHQTLEEEISIWIEENTSDDPHFRVSWLLGLEPTPGRCWAWAAEHETEDPEFLGVSFLIGLIPTPEKPVVEEEGGSGSEDEAEVEGEAAEEAVDENDEMGLRRLFGDLPYEADESNEESENKEPEEPPVLATPEFLQLCEQMDEMLSELEYVPSHASHRPRR